MWFWVCLVTPVTNTQSRDGKKEENASDGVLVGLCRVY